MLGNWPHSWTLRSMYSSRFGIACSLNASLLSFSQIVTHLRPVDLLQLCRVSKHFRTTFMSKSRRSLWVAARRNTTPLPLPEPLPGMSEPKLAALLFEHYCFVSGLNASSVTIIDMKAAPGLRCWSCFESLLCSRLQVLRCLR